VLKAGTQSYTLPPASVADAAGRLVVAEERAGAVGFPFDLACFDTTLTVESAGVVVDTLALPAFPGSYDGTSWCRLPDGAAGAGALCTPTIDAANAAYVDPAPILFDALHPVIIDLVVDQAGVDALTADPRTFVAASFTVTDGANVLGPVDVGVALKGSATGSFRRLDQKAAFKINFGHVIPGQRFLGLKALKLNNLVEDFSCVHEALAYRMLAAFGVPAARSGYAEVHLNGTSYGLHAVVEAIDATWASRHFPSAQHIYEGSFPNDLVPGTEANFDVDAGDSADVADLTALCAASQPADPDFGAGLAAVLDVPAAAKSFMASQYLAHWDGYAGATNNYYVVDDDAGRFTFVPSGLDQSLDPANAGIDPYDLRAGKSPFAEQGVYFRRCVADATCSAALDDAAAALAVDVAGYDAVADLDAIAAVVEPFLAVDPRLEIPLDQIHAVQQRTRDFLVARPAVLP
jgi:hypothetical protein